jgi:hypothetical protein
MDIKCHTQLFAVTSTMGGKSGNLYLIPSRGPQALGRLDALFSTYSN